MKITGYILDLDGTVYRGDTLTTGAREALGILRARRRKILFLSNQPLFSCHTYAEKLRLLGVPVEEGEILNSSVVLARELAHEAPGAKVFAIGEPPLLEELKKVGLTITANPNEIEYVVAAFDRTFDYRKLNIAFQALRRGARFYATNPDPSCPVEDGEIPDAAAVIAALEACSGRKVEKVFGKPSPYMVRAALSLLELPPERCAVVGDRVETDVRMAKENGLTAILVLTGVTPREKLGEAPFRPDYVLESIADLPDLDEEIGGS